MNKKSKSKNEDFMPEVDGEQISMITEIATDIDENEVSHLDFLLKFFWEFGGSPLSLITVNSIHELGQKIKRFALGVTKVKQNRECYIACNTCKVSVRFSSL